MKIVIVGCGRVGSTLAENLDADGHEVIIFDIRTSAFDRLPETFKGVAVRGDGTDAEVLRRAGVPGADIFLSLTEGDNRNIMAAQVAIESFSVPQVIAKINDPVRAATYSELGVVTLCRTNLMVDSVAAYLNLPMQTGPGIDVPQTPGREHPHPTAETIESPARPGGEAPATRGAGGTTGRANVTVNENDALRAQRLGFRRSRG
jgi:Trk K+ transport system NAD-binding subunit